jgi:hypothetical protein
MGDPFACCHRCQVFTCGHHGQRDNGIQKFFCFDCDKTILIASAINIANLSNQDTATVTKTAGVKYFEVQDLFTSFDDFKKRRVGYLTFLDEILDGEISYDDWSDFSLKNIFENLPNNSQKLLVAAAILIADTDTQEELETRGDALFLNLKTSLKVPAHG